LGYPDTYAKYNLEEQVWDYGRLQRNAWSDSDLLAYPTAATNDGWIYYHENGQDADNTVLNASFQTGYFFIDTGQEKVFVDRIYPDFLWGNFNGSKNAQIQVTLYVIQEMGQTPVTYGPFSVTENSDWIETHFRGRQVSVKVESNDIGSFWRLGLIRFRYAPDGRSGG
jgi:hypothetical protein